MGDSDKEIVVVVIVEATVAVIVTVVVTVVGGVEIEEVLITMDTMVTREVTTVVGVAATVTVAATVIVAATAVVTLAVEGALESEEVHTTIGIMLESIMEIGEVMVAVIVVVIPVGAILVGVTAVGGVEMASEGTSLVVSISNFVTIMVVMVTKDIMVKNISATHLITITR